MSERRTAGLFPSVSLSLVSLVTSLTLHSHPRSRGERSGSERSEKERNEPREMGCEGKDIRPEFLMASASRRSWSVRSPFVTLHLPFPTRSEASGRDERSGMEGRVTGCGWNGFFGRLSSCPYILSPSFTVSGRPSSVPFATSLDSD